jgi:hypothetical protein
MGWHFSRFFAVKATSYDSHYSPCNEYDTRECQPYSVATAALLSALRRKVPKLLASDPCRERLAAELEPMVRDLPKMPCSCAGESAQNTTKLPKVTCSDVGESAQNAAKVGPKMLSASPYAMLPPPPKYAELAAAAAAAAAAGHAGAKLAAREAEALGARIEVFWSGNDLFFPGTVSAFDKASMVGGGL